MADSLSDTGRYEVVILADHRAWCFPTDGRRVLSLTWDRLNSLRLPLDFGQDVLWLCGDYGLYVARSEFPQTRFFWLYEYDVLIHADDPPAILSDLDDRSDADLLATNLASTDERYIWARSLSRSYPELYRCQYPLVRVSAMAIDAMRQARHDLAGEFQAGQLDWARAEGYPGWPNDETFTATALMNKGLVCRDINTVKPGAYDQSTFHTNTIVMNGARFNSLPKDGMIYHSVRVGPAYLAAIRARSTFLSEDDLRTTLEIINRYVGDQWTASEASETARIIASAITDRQR